MKRILLKISGEAFSSGGDSIDATKTMKVAEMIQDIKQTGVEIVVVLGGGNIYRGSSLIAAGVDAADSHNMSMLSTVFNALTLKNFLAKLGEESVTMDALGVEFLEKYTAISARKHISYGNIVVCSSGTGTPFFTTDTGGVVRALETNCDAMIKLTQVDGVYDSDPKTNPDAERFDTISYDEFISQDLRVLDQTGVIMARDNTLPIYVMKADGAQDVIDLIAGKQRGTKIS